MNKPISSREEQLNVRRYNEKVMHAQLKQMDDSKKIRDEIFKRHIELDKEIAELLKAKAEREAVKPVDVTKPKSIKRKKQLEELKSLHKEVKQTKIPELSSLKRKHQLAEMEMLKKEVENSKITDIKLDSRIEGFIIKLDALTKSKVILKQVKDLLKEIEEFKVDGITGSEDIPKLLKKVEAQIKKTKNKKVVEELKALKKQVEETEFKEFKEAKSYKEKHPESKVVKMAECPCEDSKEDLKACKKEVASLMRKLKKHTK
jgi:hypothetical protein